MRRVQTRSYGFALFFAALALTGGVRVWAEEPVVELGQVVTLKSTILDREMKLAIQLPSGYEDGAARYPVVVMMGSDFRAHFAHAAADLGFMAVMGEIPPVILVGVDLPEGNGVLIPQRQGRERSRLPDRYLKFLVDELVPHVESKYRTNGYRVLYGGSNSGLFVVYSLLTQPKSFNAYLAGSPMLGWCSDLLVDLARSLCAQKDLPRRFLYLAFSDNDLSQAREGVPEFEKVLEEAKPSWLEWKIDRRHHEGHVPVVDVAMGFKALFPDFKPTQKFVSLEALKEHYEMLSSRYGFEIPVPEDMLFDMGIDRFRNKEFTLAEAVFSQEVKLYPERSRGYVGLALVSRDTGDIKKARNRLHKALEVNPESSLAKRILQTLPTED